MAEHPPLPAQPVRPYQPPGRYRATPRRARARKGDYLHGCCFWQESHVAYVPPERLYALADAPSEASPPEAHAEARDAMRRIRGLVAGLPPSERAVIVRRFGLDGRAPRSFRAIGETVGYSPERARQLQACAMARLRKWLGVAPFRNKSARELLREARQEEDIPTREPTFSPPRKRMRAAVPSTPDSVAPAHKGTAPVSAVAMRASGRAARRISTPHNAQTAAATAPHGKASPHRRPPALPSVLPVRPRP